MRFAPPRQTRHISRRISRQSRAEPGQFRANSGPSRADPGQRLIWRRAGEWPIVPRTIPRQSRPRAHPAPKSTHGGQQRADPAIDSGGGGRCADGGGGGGTRGGGDGGGGAAGALAASHARPPAKPSTSTHLQPRPVSAPSVYCSGLRLRPRKQNQSTRRKQNPQVEAAIRLEEEEEATIAPRAQNTQNTKPSAKNLLYTFLGGGCDSAGGGGGGLARLGQVRRARRRQRRRGYILHAHFPYTPSVHTLHAHPPCTPPSHTANTLRSRIPPVHSHRRQCTPPFHTPAHRPFTLHAHRSCTPHTHRPCTSMHIAHAHATRTALSHPMHAAHARPWMPPTPQPEPSQW